ncbi:helical backbone metal receptor [Pigmentibacter sp. JX0631]|uniref:ABC transporter substrate-binding protein n=1 Tax=Pigmentibacter sp. JX0631 TaxID=2976982 RepID=UPI002469BE41|nr:helical backbone metal receptor [Pigmentibacter sp. JX0631]WGL61538.1 helical backbone metal receptor [Pigmentibacter sp. JX0631]
MSLVPSLTETLCDLGLQTSIIGCTNFCISPKNITKTAKLIGGTKNPNIELILSLQPTHVIVNEEENTAEHIQILQSFADKNSFFLLITFPKTVLDSVKIIEDFGKVFFVEKSAKIWIQKIKNEYKKLKEHEKLALNYIYFIWRNPWMVAGDQSYIAHLLSIIGLSNQVKTSEKLSERYPTLNTSIDGEFYKKIDLFLFSSEPFPFKVRHISEFFQTHQLPMESFLLVNGQNLSWYGTRTLKALQYLARLKTQILEIKRRSHVNL